MSYSVSAATEAAVSASISTPVRAVARSLRNGSSTVPVARIRRQLDVHHVEWQRMAERDELGRPLRRADARPAAR